MAATNIGIDKATIEMVIRMGLPRDVVTLFQEKDRNTRQLGMTGVYAITTNWIMFVELMLSIIMPSSAPTETPAHWQVNSAISHVSDNSQQQQSFISHLMPTQQLNNYVQAYNDQIDCINLYCLL